MGEKVAEGGGGMPEDMAEAAQCSNHPYRRNPSGICAFCLQEKLGKLVSSSKSSDPFLSINPPPSSSSSPPSFASADPPASFTSSTSSTRISFLSAKHHRRKMKAPAPASAQSTAAPLHKIAAAANPSDEVVVLNRSKSVAPRRRAGPEITDASGSPRKKSFWSFFTLTNSSSALISSFGNKRRSASSATSSFAVAGNGGADLPKTGKEDEKTPHREQEEASTGNDDASGSPSGSQASSSFGRKVARSRSVGCGSRSFSGDFLERISNGFGDCTLRRVESHREAKSKASIHRRGRHGDEDSEERIKERVKCGGIFVGLGISSSIYWFSAADACNDESCHLPGTRRGSIPHGRNKSWSWSLASPMRSFWPGGVGSQSTIIAAGGTVAGSHSGTLQC